MDLILLQPGNQDLLGADSSWGNGASLIDDKSRDSVANLGKCIELVSMHQGIKQQVTNDLSNSARTSGRPIIGEFTCVKYVDKASVKFYDCCLRAEPLGKGKGQPTRLYLLRNSGDKTASIMTIALRDAIISDIQLQSHPDDMPTEQFKLNFTEILWTYTVQTADTVSPESQSSGWSMVRNRPIEHFT